jgi:hypothetical protein
VIEEKLIYIFGQREAYLLVAIARIHYNIGQTYGDRGLMSTGSIQMVTSIQTTAGLESMGGSVG